MLARSVQKLIEADEKYTAIRSNTRALLCEEALEQYGLDIEVHDISEAAIRTVTYEWRTHAACRVSWNWARIRKVLAVSHPRRLELAFWVENKLCGVAVARLSDAKEWLSLTYLEASPQPTHALKGKVVALALRGANIFADLMTEDGAVPPKVRLMNPLPGTEEWYATHGYSKVHKLKHYTYLTTHL